MPEKLQGLCGSCFAYLSSRKRMNTTRRYEAMEVSILWSSSQRTKRGQEYVRIETWLQ